MFTTVNASSLFPILKNHNCIIERMIVDDWVNVDFDCEIHKNWERLFTKLKHKNLKSFKLIIPKPKGLSELLSKETRYISPPHPYNLRKLEQRLSMKKNEVI